MVGGFGRFQSILDQIFRNLQFLRRNEIKFIARIAHQAVHQRVYGSAEFQVTAKANLQMIQVSFALSYGQQIDHGLGRVVMSSVPGIDHRNPGIHGSSERCSLFRMPHGNDICIAADHPCGICHRLTFRGTALFRTGKSQCSAAKVQHSRLKR